MWGTQAARGLEFAHKKGGIHRDIKPANLLLDSEATVKILDLGLARINADGNAATQAEITGSGTVMGTVDYMAPEQALSTRHADARADVYSLGCSLYYLLTGKAIYDPLTAKMLAHSEKPIPAVSVDRSDVPEAVEAAFRKMVAKTVEDRYLSMSEVIADLRNVANVRSGSDSNLSFLRNVATQTFQRHKTGQAQQVSGISNKTRPVCIGAMARGIVILLSRIAILVNNLIRESPQPRAIAIEGDKEIASKTQDVVTAGIASPQLAPTSVTPNEILTSPEWEWSEPENLGVIVNGKGSETFPALSGDGLTPVYQRGQTGPTIALGKNLFIATRRSLD